MNDDARIQNLQQELAAVLNTLITEDGERRVRDDVVVYRWSHPTPLHLGESIQAFCAIGQGKKHVEVGDDRYVYGPENVLITSIELPMISHVVEASADTPYLSMTLELKPAVVRSVLLDSNYDPARFERDTFGCRVTKMEVEILDATVRLMRAIQDQRDADYLAPMYIREIIYRLLGTCHANRMHQIAGMNTTSNRIRLVLDQLRQDFHLPLSVTDLADRAGMSVSSFHDHFKQVTGLTPLQYQKQLRLREARHRLLTEDLEVAEAGYAVGYREPSHFNRDYKKLFGEPPLRDIEALRATDALVTAR